MSSSLSPRYLNVMLGVWLFIAAFLWPHTYAQMTNAWILGILCVVFALVAARFQEARYLNTALAVWLFISAWALPRESLGTVWNSVLVSIAIFVVSLAKVPAYIRPGPPGASHPS
jgi:hypothetical protein